MKSYRLSPQQRRLWGLGAGAPAYRAQLVLQLAGTDSRQRLRAAVARLVGRHEILRTTFQAAGFKVPLQVVADELPPRWRETGAGGGLDELWRDELAAPFALDSGPPVHACLAPEENGTCLVLTLPALCADRRSLANLVAEMAMDLGGGPGPAAAAATEPLQYARFAEWQNGLLAEADDEAKEFWRRFGLDPAELVELPFTTRPADPACFEPRALRLPPTAGTGARLDAAAERCGVTARELLLAVWQALLWRRLGQPESLVTGVLCDGREYDVLQGAVGPIARTLPVRMRPAPGLAAGELAAALGEQLAEAREWQEHFELAAPAGTDAVAAPFFPHLFELAELGSLPLGGPWSAAPRLHEVGERFSLKLYGERRGTELLLELVYDARRHAAAAAARLAAAFSGLLEQALADLAAPLADLDAMGGEERRDTQVRFNATARSFPAGGGVHELFERQAARTPDRPALICGGSCLTYGELNRRSNQLARRLRRLGVGAEDRVALLLDRSAEMVTAIWATLKAGAAYVPIDADMPAARLAMVLAETAPAAVLTRRAQDLPASAGGGVRLDLEAMAGGAVEAGDDLGLPAAGEQLAYVLFTSGSTGTPKGVAVEHRQLLNYVHAIAEVLALPGGAHFASVSPFTADLGHTVFFPALCGGGCLHVASEEQVTDPEALAAAWERFGVDCLKIVPSHLAALLAVDRPQRLLPREALVLGGEPLGWELAARVQELAPACRVFNHYGPTETTVGVLTWACEPGRRMPGARGVPLGRPLANLRVYLADDSLRPAPIGVAAELCVGGAGVARGYLGAPDLTAARFVPDPWSRQAGARLYRTGDQVRFLPGLAVEFLGRADQQVKIRGFRVELGEIEAALKAHPGVADAVVSAAAGTLAAYVVPARRPAGSALAAAALRDHLGSRLPAPMLPETYVLLDELPRTRNGKVDRRALPDPRLPARSEARVRVAPGTRQERLLAAIWCEVLGLDEVGIHDNFFELGGDSILSIQVSARASRAGLRLTTRSLFRHQTIGQLAALAAAAAAPAGELPTGATAATAAGSPDRQPAGWRGVAPRDAAELSLGRPSQAEMDALLGEIEFEEGSHS